MESVRRDHLIRHEPVSRPRLSDGDIAIDGQGGESFGFALIGLVVLTPYASNARREFSSVVESVSGRCQCDHCGPGGRTSVLLFHVYRDCRDLTLFAAMGELLI